MKSSERLIELANGPVDARLAELLRDIAANVSLLERDFEIVRKASRLFEQATNDWMDRALKAEAANTDFDKLSEKRLGQ